MEGPKARAVQFGGTENQLAQRPLSESVRGRAPDDFGVAENFNNQHVYNLCIPLIGLTEISALGAPL